MTNKSTAAVTTAGEVDAVRHAELVKQEWAAKIPEAVTKSYKLMTVVDSLVKEARESGIQTRILESIVDAEDVDQMVPGGKIPGIRDICREDRNETTPDYLVLGFSVNESDIEEGEGLPVYFVFDVIDPNGERKILGTGATQTVFSFWRIRMKDRLPIVVRWYLSHKETDRGFRPLNMEIIDPDPLRRHVSNITATLEPAVETVKDESGWNVPA